MTTKEKIVNTAAKMLSNNGFNAFSFHDIANEIGIKTSSIHYYFPTKSDLIIEIIHYSQNIQAALFETISENKPQEKLSLLIDFYVGLADKGQMCPIVSISSDMNDIDPNIKLEVGKFYDFLADWLTSIIEEGITKNQFVTAQTPQDKSMEILNILAMFPILSRLGKERENLANLKQSVMANLINKDILDNKISLQTQEFEQQQQTIAHQAAVIAAQKKVINLYEANETLEKWEQQK
ncbi:TetR/AcrR family transcriptional regulator [Sphingobacterium sp. HMA12]|uniref:TetR/AcrR family transcriptional regulator n=1 Tax=Sphingobacterium sp. HMA12 TaxID=2050894 RepID=UPI000CEA6CA8|nr:TetR/AcrR family transcriptional regulator [Sphingobacterium sp. HMA12]